MSNFQDNFHREEEQNLDYDDSAFYYFFISILTVMLVPFTWHILKTMVTGETKINLSGKNCQCNRCQDLIKKRQKVYSKSWVRPGFFFKVAVCLSLWFVWYLTADQISQIKPLKSFDPYQILELEPGAEMSAIKKQYRRLSLIKHPDKNPDDPLAVTEFIQITKAYMTLTDETARQNWEKYGNPDGPGSFHVAIALPRFLLQKEYQVQVLGAFFFVLLIVIPGFFYFNLDQTNKDVGGVDLENRKIYAFLINENLIYKNCPALLANSIEFKGMKVKSKEEQSILAKIKEDEEVQELIPKNTQKMGQQVDVKPLVLILGYLMRFTELEHPSVQEDLEKILSKAPYLCEMMVQMAMVLAMEFKMKRSPKRITAKNVSTLLDFSQNIVQAMWKDDDNFLQLPHIDHDRINLLRKKKRQLTLEEFCRMKPEERKELDIFNDKELKDVEAVVKHFPLIDLKVEAFVEGENEIAVGDLLTIKITVTQENLKDGEETGFVHSNKYPFLKRSSWYLIFADATETDFLAIEKLVIKEKVFVKEMKDPLRVPGKLTMNVILKNDSYKGFDKQQKIEVTIHPQVQRKVIEYTKEDVEAAKEPSLMQSVMEMKQSESDDEEEEDDGQPAQFRVLGMPGMPPQMMRPPGAPGQPMQMNPQMRPNMPPQQQPQQQQPQQQQPTEQAPQESKKDQ